MSFEIQLPSPASNATGDFVTLSAERNVIIIGANGSGKSRLGVWMDLESSLRAKSHRISALKDLYMPEAVSTMAVGKAQQQLLFGLTEQVEHPYNWKAGSRFGGNPSTRLLGDFGWLLCYLYSEYNQAAVDYYRASQADTGSAKLSPAPTGLDAVEGVWSKLLPHRKLEIKSQQINAKVEGGVEYSGVHMSDGERVIFYLIGQCVAVPEGYVIIIDEPELHLHKSIQVPLWSMIESLRPDCLFVYLTHDVDFAASMAASRKIWLKSFDGQSWDWETIEEQAHIPEALLLELLGSRRQALVVEGVKGSKDSTLYQLLFPELLVIPAGSCSKVVEVVKSLNGADAAQLHRLNVIGLIDRDRRTAEEVDSLLKSNIFVLDVAEVESLFCVEEIIRLVSVQLTRDPDEDFESVMRHVFGRFSEELETQVSLRVVSEIKFRLNLFNEKVKGADALAGEVSRLAGSINAQEIHQEVSAVFEGILASRNYNALLGFYNRKSLADTVAGQLGLVKGQLFDIVLRLAKTNRVEEVRQALKPYFGNFQFLNK